MNFKLVMAALLLAFSTLTLADAVDDKSAEQLKYESWAKGVWNSLDKQSGVIKLPDAVATLNVPQDFVFLNAKDASTVLVDVWGNPPGQSILGMLFPAGNTPFDGGSWAVTISYDEDGYVSDEDAADINYTELLETMQADTKAASEARVAQGYPAINLVGWAAQPYYDATTHKMHWAKELKFAGHDVNTLNYNIRMLGRKGVLVLNFIASMDQKTTIESNLDTVLNMADFDQDSSYSDFDPDLDTVAAYGLGALVAGKVIAKTGFFVMALVFLKKFAVVFIMGLVVLLKRFFKDKKGPSGAQD